MQPPEVFAELDRAIGEAAPGDLATLLGRIVEAEARVRLRLLIAPSRANQTTAATTSATETWISPEQAARIAGLPMDAPDEARRSVRRLYEWARNQRWASRPSRRCLRISEWAFRRWLAARTS